MKNSNNTSPLNATGIFSNLHTFHLISLCKSITLPTLNHIQFSFSFSFLFFCFLLMFNKKSHEIKFPHVANSIFVSTTHRNTCNMPKLLGELSAQPAGSVASSSSSSRAEGIKLCVMQTCNHVRDLCCGKRKFSVV